MPQPLVVPSPDVIWACANMFGTLAGGVADAVPFGSLQDVQIDCKFTLKELQDPGFLDAIAAGYEKREITIKAKWAKVRIGGLYACLGGTETYSSPSTTLSLGADFGPLAFKVHILNNDTSGLEIICYKVVSEQLSIPLKPKDFVIPDFSGKLFVDSATSKLMDIIITGDEHVPAAS